MYVHCSDLYVLVTVYGVRRRVVVDPSAAVAYDAGGGDETSTPETAAAAAAGPPPPAATVAPPRVAARLPDGTPLESELGDRGTVPVIWRCQLLSSCSPIGHCAGPKQRQAVNSAPTVVLARERGSPREPIEGPATRGNGASARGGKCFKVCSQRPCCCAGAAVAQAPLRCTHCPAHGGGPRLTRPRRSRDPFPAQREAPGLAETRRGG
jgi:hypothetical protein